MKKSVLGGFRIVQHTHRLSREGGSRVGYHCANCGCFYAEGNFTIESTEYVLGSAEKKFCCQKERPTPLLFETIEDARAFVSLLRSSDASRRAVLIDRCALVTAHFNKKLITEHKQTVLH